MQTSDLILLLQEMLLHRSSFRTIAQRWLGGINLPQDPQALSHFLHISSPYLTNTTTLETPPTKWPCLRRIRRWERDSRIGERENIPGRSSFHFLPCPRHNGLCHCRVTLLLLGILESQRDQTRSLKIVASVCKMHSPYPVCHVIYSMPGTRNNWRPHWYPLGSLREVGM
jgi:hypothetical protein